MIKGYVEVNNEVESETMIYLGEVRSIVKGMTRIVFMWYF